MLYEFEDVSFAEFQAGFQVGRTSQNCQLLFGQAVVSLFARHCTPKRNAAYNPSQPTQGGWSIRPCSFLLGTTNRKRSAPICCSDYDR
jgi:hypothetical protein